ncbi:MAG: hypothetical protein E4H08_08145 [Candidatus Atribacteria bacterium]|nr:MAG: hypothetical protein E4H08_08145 [Candidatus Atribacteria bacterium]
MRRKAHRSSSMGDSEGVGRRWILPAVAMVLLLASGFVGYSQPLDVSGRFGLDTIMIPMPATLSNDVQVETPAEYSVFKCALEASLRFSATWDNVRLDWDSAMNIAGPERAILESIIPLGPVTIKPELWFAVPFETVTDIDHFTNYIVIPPGDVMFVKTRWTVEGSYGGIDFNLLFLLEDVGFPDPGADFAALTYPLQSQSFRYGSILTVAAEVYPGVTLSSVTNINADGGSNAVKGHSASGQAYRSCDPRNDSWFNETLTLRGLRYGDVPFWVRVKIDPLADPMFDISGGGSLTLDMFDLELSGSISLFPTDVSGFSFSGSICDSVQVSVSLSEQLHFQGASLSSSSSLDLGLMSLQISGSTSVVAGEGIPGFNFSASVTQGTFSGSMSVAISDQQDVYRLTSFSARFSVTQAPAAYSVSVAFGRTGLKRATVSIGMVF